MNLGMAAKVDAALASVERGVPATGIASGKRHDVIHEIIRGDLIGTLFIADPSVEYQQGNPSDTADSARSASLSLQKLPLEVRVSALHLLAQKLEDGERDILEANSVDLDRAQRSNL